VLKYIGKDNYQGIRFTNLNSCFEEHCMSMASQSVSPGCWPVRTAAEGLSLCHLGWARSGARHGANPSRTHLLWLRMFGSSSASSLHHTKSLLDRSTQSIKGDDC